MKWFASGLMAIMLTMGIVAGAAQAVKPNNQSNVESILYGK